MSLVLLFITVAAFLMLLGAAGVLYGLSHPPRTTLGRAIARGLPADPGDMGLPFDETVLQLSDGRTTPAWILPGHDADGPVILVTHGWGDSRYGAQLWVPLLLPHASRIVVYDMRGHGDSAAPTSRCGLVEPDDLLALADQIAARRFVFFGYSMGACVSLVAAAKDAQAARDRVVGVIGDGIYRRWDEPVVGMFRLRRWPRQPMMWLAGLWMRATSAEFRRFDRAGWAAKLGCPLLLLHGGDDPICPYDSAAEVAAAAPRCELVTFHGGGHLDLAEGDPDRYRDALCRFFEVIKTQQDSG